LQACGTAATQTNKWSGWQGTWCRGTRNKCWWAKIHWTGKGEKSYWHRFEVITGDSHFHKNFIVKVDVVTKLNRERTLRTVVDSDSDSEWTTA
jgi:hypothetical protein